MSVEVKCDWLCYIIKSVDSNRTYVGATNNLLRRLNDHNGMNGQSRGAKATKGQMWYPIVITKGFTSKNACLSFESSLRKIKTRKCNKKYKYKSNMLPIEKRIVDLYNLLYNPSTLNKWTVNTLSIYQLEKYWFDRLHFCLPKDVGLLTGIASIKDL
jgi:predicted GIY-YIG superfamily endonuclease